jgi:hypothetical protein
VHVAPAYRHPCARAWRRGRYNAPVQRPGTL